MKKTVGFVILLVFTALAQAQDTANLRLTPLEQAKLQYLNEHKSRLATEVKIAQMLLAQADKDLQEAVRNTFTAHNVPLASSIDVEAGVILPPSTDPKQ